MIYGDNSCQSINSFFSSYHYKKIKNHEFSETYYLYILKLKKYCRKYSTWSTFQSNFSIDI